MAPSAKLSSPKRAKEKIEKEESLKRDLKKSRKMIDELASFQNDLGGAIIPMQKISLYVFCSLLFVFGLGMVIYGATITDNSSDIKNNIYYGGGGTMAVSVVLAVLGHYWFKLIQSSRTLRQINALEFETQFARDIFRPNPRR
jgi:hypothetical protein